MNLLFTHRSGGQLWQGSIDDVKRLIGRPPDKISVIGLFAVEHQSIRPNPLFEIIRAGFDDKFIVGPNELEKISKIADGASNLFADRIRSGKGCLSSCAMGLNRSGLVSALTLMKVAGTDPAETVDLIRRIRGSREGLAPLSNPNFVDLIHRMAPVIGTKSTWTSWKR